MYNATNDKICLKKIMKFSDAIIQKIFLHVLVQSFIESRKCKLVYPAANRPLVKTHVYLYCCKGLIFETKNKQNSL